MISTATSRRRRPLLASSIVAGATLTVLALSACSGGGGTSAVSGGSTFTYLATAENTQSKSMLPIMAKKECAAAQKASPLTITSVPQSSLDQKLQLLAGQGALPSQFDAGNAPALTQSLAKAGDIMDLSPKLTKLGVADDILPAAASTIKALYGGKLYALPYQFNVEGFFYNKKILAENNITPPATWDDLVADAAKFKAAGVTPFAASGQQGWPLTRLISGYLFRDLGANALKNVADGKAKLTDPQYVRAATAVANLGAKGYFGQGIGSISMDTANSQFLTGKTAMYYDGSWLLTNINDPKQNTIGANNVGFMPFPAVSGGKGSIDQYPANVGLPTAINAKADNSGTDRWLTCIAKSYGSAALKSQGAISGFKVNTPVAGLPASTKLVQDKIASTTSSVLWFEALFSTKATITSQTNAASLVTGSLAPASFMQMVQSDLGSN